MSRAAGSLIVTIPSVYYLLQPQIERYSGKQGGHGGHGGHGEHGHGGGEDEEHDEEQSEQSGGDREGDSGEGEDSGPADSEEGSQESTKESGSTEDSKENAEETTSDGADGEAANKSGPDTPSDKGSDDTAHETESGKNIEGVQFKGATSGGTKEGEQGDTRKHIPDAKGGSKKRIESDYGMKLGEAQESQQDSGAEDMVRLDSPINFQAQELLKQHL